MLEYIGEIFHHFVDPKKRIFLGYIALSIAIALLWLVIFKKKGLKSAIFKVFDKKVLLSGSAISDYKMFLINRVLMLVLSPYLLTQLAVATFFYYSLLSLPLSESAAAFSTEGLFIEVIIGPLYFSSTFFLVGTPLKVDLANFGTSLGFFTR